MCVFVCVCVCAQMYPGNPMENQSILDRPYI